MKRCKSLGVYFKEPFVYFPPLLAYSISWWIILLFSTLALIGPLTAVCVSVSASASRLRLRWTCTRMCVITCSLLWLHTAGPCTSWGNLSADCATSRAPARKHSNTRAVWILVSVEPHFSPHQVILVVFLSREEFPIRNFPFLLCFSCLSLDIFRTFFPPVSLYPAVRPPRAPGCLRPWQWRRIIVVAVTF